MSRWGKPNPPVAATIFGKTIPPVASTSTPTATPSEPQPVHDHPLVRDQEERLRQRMAARLSEAQHAGERPTVEGAFYDPYPDPYYEP